MPVLSPWSEYLPAIAVRAEGNEVHTMLETGATDDGHVYGDGRLRRKVRFEEWMDPPETPGSQQGATGLQQVKVCVQRPGCGNNL